MTQTATRIEDIPAIRELISSPKWVNHDERKTPLNPHNGYNAKWKNPKALATFAKVRYNVGRTITRSDGSSITFTGFGRVLTKEGITLLDADDCIDNQGNLTPWGMYLVNLFKTYTEISPGGHGLHFILKGSLPENINVNKEADTADGENRLIEAYDCDRYITVTGNQLPDTSDTIEERQAELDTFYQEVRARRDTYEAQKREQKQRQRKQQTMPGPDTPYGLKALEEECDNVARTHEGGRNHQLNISAFALGQIVGGGALSRSTVERGLFFAAQRSGLSDIEIEKTMRSGLEAGIAEPRTPPARQMPRYQVERGTASNGNGVHANGMLGVGQGNKSFNRTDFGNAERLVAWYGNNLRYCHAMNNWIVWNGKDWQEDKDGSAERLAKRTVRSIYGEAEGITDDTAEGKAERKAIAMHAIRSESKKAIRDMLLLAQSEPGIPIKREDLDTDPWLLNCVNGTIDLRSGKLREHRRQDYITRYLATRFNPDAVCPLWEATIYTIFNGNTRLISFFKRAAGYALTGDTSEQCFFLLFGKGHNGKSTLLEVILKILEDYAQSAEFKAFLSRDNEGIRNDLARTNGKRLVVAKEADKGKMLAEALIKTLTGGDTITARFLHQEYFDFKPQFKLFLATNHKPEIKGTDLGIWRRVRLIPFTVTIPEEERDKDLPTKLLQEAEGILAWLVEGCLEWQREGLGAPDEVKQATASYRAEMDIIAQFLRENCVLETPAPGRDKPGKLKTGTKELIACYEAWCEGEKPDTKLLKTTLHELGYFSKRGKGGRFFWHGIELIEPRDGDDSMSESEGTPPKSEPSEGSEAEKGNSLAKSQNSRKILQTASLPSLGSLPSPLQEGMRVDSPAGSGVITHITTSGGRVDQLTLTLDRTGGPKTFYRDEDIARIVPSLVEVSA